MVDTIFFDIVIVTVIAAGLVWIFAGLRQPPLLAYLVVGILVGPKLFDLIEAKEPIEALARFGVAFLLFMVGLELDIGQLKKVGKISILTGLGQIIFTAAIGLGFSLLLGFGTLEALYIAVALTFSSTIIIVKLLSEKKDLQSLYGRIAIGFLLVQNLVAVFALMMISLIPTWSEGIDFTLFAQVLGGAFVLFGFVFFASWKILPRLFTSFARHRDTLFLGAIAWCFLVAAMSEIMNLPFEAGALIAGIAIAPLPFRTEISGRIKSLRDFFMILFFVILGMELSFSLASLPVVIGFSLFVLIGNPIVVMVVMGLMGYHRRISFFSGLTVAQISEFSLIIAAMGLTVGHISQNTFAIITSVGVITIAASTYLITYNEQIYNKIQKILKIFQKKDVKYETGAPEGLLSDHILLFGFDRVGNPIAKKLREKESALMVVDFNPDIIEKLKKEDYYYTYGDATDMELLENVNADSARIIISTIPSFDENKLLLERTKKFKAQKVVVAENRHEASDLYKLGADYVILPYQLGGVRAARILSHAWNDPEKLRNLKEQKLLFDQV